MTTYVSIPPTAGGSAFATGIHETGSPTDLAIGAIADGQYLRRVGTDIVGAASIGGGYDTVQAAGVALTMRTVLNFGAGLTAVDNGGSTRTDVTLNQGVAPTWTAAHNWTTSPTPITVVQGVATSGSPTALSVTGGAHTTLAASTEAVDALFNFARTVQFATGALATQRTVRVRAETLAFVAASVVALAGTVAISGPPIAGANATLTEAYALLIESGQVATPLGTAGAPSIVPQGDSNTGPFSPAADRYAISTGGTQRFEVSNTAVISTVQFSAPAGSVGAPSYSITGDLDSGFFSGGSDAITLALGGVARIAWGLSTAVATPAAAAAGAVTHWTWTGAAHIGQTAGAEVTDVNFNLARTVTWATGAIATQRSARIQAETMAFVGASVVSLAATVAISGPPIAGANATLTEAYALLIESGAMAVQAGTAGAPAIVTQGDSNTGPFSPGGDRWAVSAGGTQRFEVSSTALISTVQVSNAVGSAGAPAYSFTARLTDGMYSPAAGQVGIATSGAARSIYADTGVTWTPAVATTGSPSHWTLTGAAHTTLTASTEAIDVNLNLARTVQFATGALTTQRAMRIQAPTYAFVGASTITTASTLEISGAPTAGTNATITNNFALTIGGTGQIGADISTVGNPGYAFLTDSDTGVARNGANIICLVAGGNSKVQASATQTTFAQGAASSGSSTTFIWNAPANTGQAASTEQIMYDFRASTVQHAQGALATQRHMIFGAPTYSFATGASTLTDASTLAIVDAPIAGTNAAITNAYALWLQAGMLRMDGAWRATATISPTQLTANQNNYAPTNFATCYVIRQDVDVTGWTITGLAGGADGRIVVLINIGVGATNNITLTHDDGASTAANRFFLPNAASIVLLQHQSVTLRYDSTDSRWRVIGRSVT